MLDQKQRRLLIIDDEPDYARLLRSHFSGLGYRVRTAGTAARGLAAAKSLKPHLVIVDLRLPDMDGLELSRTLRLSGPLPVLLLTAAIETRPKALASYRLSGCGYREKNNSLASLAKEVERLIRI